MALVNIQKTNVEYLEGMNSSFRSEFRWADDLDIPEDEILLRVRYERYF
ncbi:MAG: hypothetical protein ACTSWX_02445 [Promethearchaeota archaeon]